MEENRKALNQLREKLKKFLTEESILKSEQLSCFEIVKNTGGALGYMDFKKTGQLLPILPGWDTENGKILNVYHDTEVIWHPLYIQFEFQFNTDFLLRKIVISHYQNRVKKLGRT